ncbi:ATP-dependent DNA ligase [Silvibacterium acidisoli]|uniref:ATP-dependent DNA ligase n=1 Tax=Acidobacteriaceae bacterium ZG23-2 TaxID=2883246 RepID=UPI00406C634A
MSSFFPFAELCEALAATTKKLEKRALITVFLQKLPVDDAGRAALYLSGTPFPETDRRALNVGGALLSKVLQSVSGAKPSALTAAYRRHGDIGSAASELLASHDHAATLTLAEVEQDLAAIAAARGPGAKLPLLTGLLQKATPIEAKYLLKLIAGDMRTGVKQALVEEAIASAWSAEPAAVRHATMLQGNLPEVVSMAASGTLDQARMRLFHPLGLMLASPVASVEEAMARFAAEIREEQTEGIAEPEPVKGKVLSYAQIEDKYDGVRAQLHMGDATQPGRVELFSRSREEMSETFPELVEACAAIDEPVILDGEVLAWTPLRDDDDPGRAQPFSALQQRIGRKIVSREMREQLPVVFMAFDILARNGELLLELPLHERREILIAFLDRHAAGTAQLSARGQSDLFAPQASTTLPRLMLAPATRLETAEQLDNAYTEARERGNEGVMLKSIDSLYQPGRRGMAWLKLKRELATLDVVVTRAEFGHGRRAGVLSDYTFAVRDGDKLRNVGKAYSGLTDAEIAELTEYFKDHTIEEYGHFRTVEPLKVLEVAFNNVMRSDRHDSGFALRFPRILRIRDDKPVEEIDTLARVEEIYESQPDKPAETE